MVFDDLEPPPSSVFTEQFVPYLCQEVKTFLLRGNVTEPVLVDREYCNTSDISPYQGSRQTQISSVLTFDAAMELGLVAVILTLPSEFATTLGAAGVAGTDPIAPPK